MSDALKALTDLGRTLVERGVIPTPHWREAWISGCLDLDDQGVLVGVEIFKKMGIKTQIPALPQRGSNVVGAFLSGSPAYWGGEPETARGRACLADQLRVHEEVLDGVNHDAARALLSYLRKPRGDVAALAGARQLIPRFHGAVLSNIPAIRAAWESTALPNPDAHPGISGVVPGASPAKLVSAGLEAAESYGKEGVRLPPGIDPQFYGIALEYLLRQDGTYKYGTCAAIAWSGDATIQAAGFIWPWHVWTPQVWPNERVHVLIVDLVNRGRIAIRLYQYLEADEFKAAIEKWRSRSEADKGETDLYPWPLIFRGQDGEGIIVPEVTRSILAGRAPGRMTVMMAMKSKQLGQYPLSNWHHRLIHAAVMQ